LYLVPSGKIHDTIVGLFGEIMKIAVPTPKVAGGSLDHMIEYSTYIPAEDDAERIQIVTIFLLYTDRGLWSTLNFHTSVDGNVCFNIYENKYAEPPAAR
jgi:hypothetical protein